LSKVRDVIVVGAGPAGLAAAVYAASEGLDVRVIEHALLNDHEELRNDPLLAVLVDKPDLGKAALAGKGTLIRLPPTSSTRPSQVKKPASAMKSSAVEGRHKTVPSS
jgi:choline dehydrogenase-like flavoprotein